MRVDNGVCETFWIVLPDKGDFGYKVYPGMIRISKKGGGWSEFKGMKKHIRDAHVYKTEDEALHAAGKLLRAYIRRSESVIKKAKTMLLGIETA